MKKLLLILLLASPAWATQYYVDETASGASNSNDGLTQTYSSGVHGPWLTMKKCADTIVADDICTVLPGGSYDEIVVPTHSGTSGHQITYNATGSPRAIVRAFKSDSKSYFTIDGFEITATGMSAGASICFAGQTPQICVTGTTPTGVQILNNNIHDTAVSAILLGNAVNLIFRGNTVAHVPSGNIALQSNLGNGVLIENNTFSYVPDYIAPSGTKYVVRNNVFGPADPAEPQHMDVVQTNAIVSYVLIEGNTVVDNVSADNHFFLDQATSSDNWIARYNTVYQSKSGILLGGAQKIYVYNNTYYRVNDYKTSNFMLSYCTLPGNCNLNPTARISSVFVRNNIWYASGTSSCVTPDTCIYAKGVGANVIDKDYDNRYLSGDPIETHQLNSDPQFVNAAGGNFSLSAGSLSIDAGGQLTTVAVADTGTGTSLILNDANMFQDGWAGATPDHIAVGTAGNTATISSIDYATGTVTLTGSIMRNDGDPVYLFSKSDGVTVLYGTAPDIGSMEYNSTTPNLTSITPSYGNLNATTSVSIAGTVLNGASSVLTVSGSGVTVSNVVQVSAILVTADFAVDVGAATGARTVTLTTVDGTSNTVTFTIEPLVLTSVAPAAGNRNTTVPVTLTGTAFDLAGGATVNISGTGVTQANLTVVNHTTITDDFIIAVGATISTRTVSVTTANGTSNTVSFDVLAVANPALLTGVSPNFGYQGATVNFTLTGSNLDTGNASVSVSGSGVTVSGLTVVGSTVITGQFHIASDAATTARSVTVTTDTGTSNPVTFSVRGLGSAGRGKLVGRGGR